MVSLSICTGFSITKFHQDDRKTLEDIQLREVSDVEDAAYGMSNGF